MGDIQIINKWIDETCFWKELFLIMAKLKDIGSMYVYAYVYKPFQTKPNQPVVPLHIMF